MDTMPLKLLLVEGRTDDSPLHWHCILCVVYTSCIVPAAHPAGDHGCSPVDLRTLAEDGLDTGVLLVVSISIPSPMPKLGYISIVHRSPRRRVVEVRVKKRFDK